ncbi:hypothetical protein FQR65_LT18463 [Abscondita terminalis]|nr:hypothetical protein FQR65_LT18463 [Abscondita terminalis]
MDVKFGFTLQNLIDEGRVVKEDVDKLKSVLKTKLSDELLAIFLISCDHQHDLAKVTISNYFKYRQMVPEIFSDRDITNHRLQNVLHVGVYAVLPKRTPDNCSVVITKLQDTDYRKADLESSCKMKCMVLDLLTYFDPPDGLITIVDLEGINFMHLTVIKIRILEMFMRYVQEGLPLKLKNVHVFNSGYVVRSIYNLCKPFLKNEIKKLARFVYINVDMDWFHKTWIAKELLPEEYGGDLPSVMVHHSNTAQQVALLHTYFETDERQTRDYVQ